MCDKKGSTLIESLFAFEIYTSILVLFLTLFTTIFSQEIKIKNDYQHMLEKEGEFICQETFIENIEMVLHS